MKNDRGAQKRCLAGVLLGVCLLITSGCTSSRIPSDSEAQKSISGATSWFSEVGAKMVDFRKLNGESKEVFGQKVYVYQFLAAFELPAGLAWKTGLLSPGFARDPGPRGSGNVMERFTTLPKGTTAVMRGTINFRSTEKGWIPEHPDWIYGYCTDLKPEACYKKLSWDILQ